MIINEELIELELSVASKEEAIQQLCLMAKKANRLDNIHEYIAKVNEREAEISTDLGQGIAIPHGKSSAVIEPFVIFAKLCSPIQWDEIDHSLVDLVFMIGVPELSKSNVHLKIISQLAGKLIDEEIVEQLRFAKSKTQVLNYLKTITL